MHVEPYDDQYLDAIVQLSLRAWTPVFASLQTTLDADVYRAFYPETWQVSQAQAVKDACGADDTNVWVAVEATTIVGFVVVKGHPEDNMGEIYMIAVDPDSQRHGIGTALIDCALTWMKTSGFSLAMVETGGDPGHAPARCTYEKAGFGLFPVARYFKPL